MNSFSRIILVGCGGIARAHVGAVGAANIAALCDSNIETARRLREECALDAPIFAELEQALRCSHGDAAIVCTPPTTHAQLVRQALESNVNVLCEKPLATRAVDAEMLVELAQTRGLKLRTSAKYRFATSVQLARNWPALGELKRVQIAFGAPFDYARSWHANRELSGGGVWMDNGPHALDLARFFAGELEVCALKNWSCDGDLETEISVILRSETGVAVEIELSWLRGLGDWFVVVQGENGILKVGWRQTQWQLRNGKMQITDVGYDKAECFARQWRSFNFNGATSCAAADGARVVELLEAVYAAAR